MRSQACAQVISGWRRRRPSPKRRSTAPRAIGVTPGSSAASSSERARCRGGAGVWGGQEREKTEKTYRESHTVWRVQSCSTGAAWVLSVVSLSSKKTNLCQKKKRV